jgi:hypothetical protein
MKALAKNYKSEIKEHGLWIVTQIYSTKTAYLAVLDSSKKSREIGFTAEVGGIGKVNPHSGWSTNSSNCGWTKYESKVCVLLRILAVEQPLTAQTLGK